MRGARCVFVYTTFSSLGQKPSCLFDKKGVKNFGTYFWLFYKFGYYICSYLNNKKRVFFVKKIYTIICKKYTGEYSYR